MNMPLVSIKYCHSVVLRIYEYWPIISLNTFMLFCGSSWSFNWSLLLCLCHMDLCHRDNGYECTVLPYMVPWDRGSFANGETFGVWICRLSSSGLEIFDYLCWRSQVVALYSWWVCSSLPWLCKSFLSSWLFNFLLLVNVLQLVFLWSHYF